MCPVEVTADEELLDQARAGDDRAFRILVDRYAGIVAATVIGMLGAGDDAEDVGQETFIRFHRSLDRFRGESSVATYLTRIAINLSLTELKRRRRWTERFKAPFQVAEDVFDRADPERDRERKVQFDRIWDAIDTLTPEHRAVVVLRMIDGYSTREAADILTVPQGTVMSRLARAMGRLESQLKETD